jgi:hypothetical protein
MAQSRHAPEDFCRDMRGLDGLGHCGCMATLAADFDALEKLFAAGTDGIPHTTDAHQRNWVYDAMNGAHDAAVKEIQALYRLSTRLACDAAPLEALKAVVRNAWGNVTHAVSAFYLSEADPQVLTARERLTAIATLVLAMQKKLCIL